MAGAVFARPALAERRNRRQPLVKEIRIYFEGDDALRPGFSQFFADVKTAARERRINFHLIAGGATAERIIETALKKPSRSLEYFASGQRGSSASQVRRRQSLLDGSAHGGVVSGRSGGACSLLRQETSTAPRSRRIPESRKFPKSDVLDCLKEASKRTQKGRYHKTKHAPEILQRIDPLKSQERRRRIASFSSTPARRSRSRPVSRALDIRLPHLHFADPHRHGVLLKSRLIAS